MLRLDSERSVWVGNGRESGLTGPNWEYGWPPGSTLAGSKLLPIQKLHVIKTGCVVIRMSEMYR